MKISRCRVALSIGMPSPRIIDFLYRHLGWNESPRFQALRDNHEAYLAAERLKLLAVARGDTGFTSWTRLPETCAILDQSRGLLAAFG